MTTIKHILDNHTSREAATIFGDIIKANTVLDEWDHIYRGAHASDIVCGDHPNSKKIDKFAPSQILRAMTAKGMAIWVNKIKVWNATDSHGNATANLTNLSPSEEVHEALTQSHDGLSVPCWPWSFEPTDYMLGTDISQYVEFESDDDDPDAKSSSDERPPAEADVDATAWDDTMIDIANMAVSKASKGSIADVRTLVVERDCFKLEALQLRNEVMAAQANSYNVEPLKDCLLYTSDAADE